MEISFSERQQRILAARSAESGRSVGDLIAEAIDRMVDDQNWFDAQLQVGVDQMERGEFLEEDEMDARVAGMLKA